jgi:hypothetical protein
MSMWHYLGSWWISRTSPFLTSYLLCIQGVRVASTVCLGPYMKKIFRNIFVKIISRRTKIKKLHRLAITAHTRNGQTIAPTDRVHAAPEQASLEGSDSIAVPVGRPGTRISFLILIIILIIFYK